MCKGNKKNPEETEPNPGILAPEAKVLMRKKIFCFLAVLGMEPKALHVQTAPSLFMDIILGSRGRGWELLVSIRYQIGLHMIVPRIPPLAPLWTKLTRSREVK